MNFKIATTAAAFLLATAIGASAQTGSPAVNAGRSAAAGNSSPTAQAQTSAANEPLRQQVQANLTKAGFTDIKIMPTSFMVRAKDQSGNPVMMVINPDSFTEVTAVSGTGNSNSPQGNNNATAQKH